MQKIYPFWQGRIYTCIFQIIWKYKKKFCKTIWGISKSLFFLFEYIIESSVDYIILMKAIRNFLKVHKFYPTWLHVFDRLYFTQCLTSFSSIDHLLRLCAWFLILFHLKYMRLSQSTNLLMFLSSETLMSIIRTGLPILEELINLVNSVIIFLSQMTLLRQLTFLLRSQTVILMVLLFWISYFWC